jgi:hypothetical protein
VLVIASVGVMFMLNGIVRFIIGPDHRMFTTANASCHGTLVQEGDRPGRGAGGQDDAGDLPSRSLRCA